MKVQTMRKKESKKNWKQGYIYFTKKTFLWGGGWILILPTGMINGCIRKKNKGRDRMKCKSFNRIKNLNIRKLEGGIGMIELHLMYIIYNI